MSQERKEKLGDAGVNTLGAYREATGDPLPAIVVVIDNYAAFASTYANAEDTLVDLSREGGNLGIHLVLTAVSTMTIKLRISSNMGGAVVLNMTERSDYTSIVGRNAGLEPAPVAGR